MNRYTHFTIEEREKARCLLEKGLSIRAIARILRRAPSSVSREIQRNQYKMEIMQHTTLKSFIKSERNIAEESQNFMMKQLKHTF